MALRPRATIRRTPDALEISMPTKKSLFALVFITIWLAGWVLGEVFASIYFLSGAAARDQFPLGLWLLMWTIGGTITWLQYLTMLLGRENLILRGDVLILRRELFGYGRTRTYPRRRVGGFRFEPKKWFTLENSVQRYWNGPIVFNCGTQIVRCGNGVDEGQALEIIELLKTASRTSVAADQTFRWPPHS